MSDRGSNAPPRGGFIRSQRLRIHYVEWGDPAAPPLVLVHGARDHGRSWDAVAQAMASERRVIVPDLRGHGDSDHVSSGDYAMSGYVVDLAALVAERVGAPVTLVGHSLGGNIAIRYAAACPEAVSRLVAIEGLGPSPGLTAERDATLPEIRLRRWIDEARGLTRRVPRGLASLDDAVARMMAANPRLDTGLARHLTEQGIRRDADGRWRWKFDDHLRLSLPETLSGDAMAAMWRAVRCPVLLVYGAQSWASNPAEDGRAAHFADAQVALVQGAGHWVHHDREHEFIGRLRDFLGGS